MEHDWEMIAEYDVGFTHHIVVWCGICGAVGFAWIDEVEIHDCPAGSVPCEKRNLKGDKP